MKLSNSNNKMLNKDSTEINIIYNINIKDKKFTKKYINLLGEEFVKNNKNICNMIIDNKECEIEEKYKIKNYDKNILQIKLICLMNAHHYHLYLIFQNGILLMLII